MNNLIFETLISEAHRKVEKLHFNGVALDEAINEIATSMELDSPEVDELKIRAKKAPTPQPVVIEDDGDVDPASEEMPKDNTIQFDSDDELETAMGVLMYKGIPWVNRGVTSVTFMTSDHVRQAHDALKRRWDFLNLDQRKVASIQFDNLEDYNKVLDFIASKNMMVLTGLDSDLDNDVDVELAEAEAEYKKAVKLAKKEGQPVPEKSPHNMSYRAVHKDKAVDPKTLDPLADPTNRSIMVSKRWK